MAPETSSEATAQVPREQPPARSDTATSHRHSTCHVQQAWCAGDQVATVDSHTTVETLSINGDSSSVEVTSLMERVDISHRPVPSLGKKASSENNHSSSYFLDLPSVNHKVIFEELLAKITELAPEDNVPPYNDEDLLNRVLVARNLQVPEAFRMWMNIVAWRKHYQPQILSEEEAAPYLSKGVVSICGPDKQGRPCIYALNRNHIIDAENHDSNLRTIVNLLEKTTVESTRTADGFIAVIIDQEGVGRKNMDTNLFVGKPGLVQILQEYYPERLGSCYILHTSWIFRLMWAIISPFLDEKTRRKVHVLARTEDLLEHFSFDALPPELRAKLNATAHRDSK